MVSEHAPVSTVGIRRLGACVRSRGARPGCARLQPGDARTDHNKRNGEHPLKRINLSAALSTCTDDIVRQKLAHKVGLPPQAIEQVFAASGSIVIAALAARAAEGRDETIAVFGALMSRNINPRIRDECAGLVDSTGKLKELEHAGFTLVAHATG